MKYLITFILFFAMTSPVFASTVSGVVTTGVSTGNGVTGVVITAPVAGTYTGAQTIILTAPGSSEIRYFLNTLDLNSALTCSTGAVYGSSVSIGGSGLLRAIACFGGNQSPLASFTYVINGNTNTAPPSGGSGGGSGGGGGGGGTSSPVASPSAVDFTSDGSVNIFDFNILMSNWGTTSGATHSTGDADGNGTVDIFDFNLLMNGWGA